MAAAAGLVGAIVGVWTSSKGGIFSRPESDVVTALLGGPLLGGGFGFGFWNSAPPMGRGRLLLVIVIGAAAAAVAVFFIAARMMRA
jgi:hypothetical protein